jgi:cysteine synthase
MAIGTENNKTEIMSEFLNDSRTKSDLKVYTSMEQLVANKNNPTPLLLLNSEINSNRNFKIFVKLEYLNPFGSIKDRIALYMLKHGSYKKGQTLLEASSGNTAIALAALAPSFGLNVEIAVPERIPEDKKKILKLLGVTELWEAEDDLCPIFPNEGARGVVNGLLHSEGFEKFVHLNQYENDSNSLAHYEQTGPEIWSQTEGKITHFFSSIGTGGTISGVGSFLKEQSSEIKVIGVEPDDFIHNQFGMKKISGLPEQYYPKIINKDVIDEYKSVKDSETYDLLKKLLKNGYPFGVSTASSLQVALDYASKNNQGVAVVIAADNIFKYLSVL